MNDISRSICLVPRNEHFHFEATESRDWHGSDPVKTIVFNALSVLFPEGEKFFMDSVKAVRDDIDDPVLKEQIRAFLIQEAVHTREHVMYNKQLDAQGYRATEMHLALRKRLGMVRKLFGPKRQLAVTCAIEHFTAMMADLLMRDEVFLDGADGDFKKVWLWHALEEAEHKGVAFDTFQQVTGREGYFLRCWSMFMATIIFNIFIFKHLFMMMKDVGLAGSLKSWGRMGWFLLGKPGFFRRMAPHWLAYFLPGYHPWKDDNRHLIAKTERELLGGSSVYDVYDPELVAA